MSRQPWLHDLQIAVDGPATVLTDRSGAIGGGATGWLVDDRRVLRTLRVDLDGHTPDLVAAVAGGDSARVWSAARHLGGPGADPTVEVHQLLTVRGHELLLELLLSSRATEEVSTRVCLELGSDGTDLSVLKGGRDLPPAPPVEVEETIWWSDERHRTVVHTDPAPAMTRQVDTGAVQLSWPVRLRQGEQVRLGVRLQALRTGVSAFDADAGSGGHDWGGLVTEGEDSWVSLVRDNLRDLQHLLQRDPLSPGDLFAAAGTPWYLTLFGRDSIWAARMMLPFSSALAEGTLRTLARRQAHETDARTAAEPGKMPHEVRRTVYAEGDLDLPTVYYGTVDATPLWVVLLHEAWGHDLPLGVVRELLPSLRAALGWMEQAVERSPDGLLRYLDESGQGLSNQGWKDSGDSMRRRDGSIAPAPIALVEAQAYAVQAADAAADLLEALDEPGAEHWRDWGRALAQRVRETFWVGPEQDRYLAMALDADGAPVDGVGSNMGHALATGMLTPAEETLVVQRLMRPDMMRRFGIATLSADNPAYNPTGYHTGSVWTHDSAIVLRGMALAGFDREAAVVHEALVRLSTRMGHRFPELVAGDPVGSDPVPYPAACRPQAWAAASAAVLLRHRPV